MDDGQEIHNIYRIYTLSYTCTMILLSNKRTQELRGFTFDRWQRLTVRLNGFWELNDLYVKVGKTMGYVMAWPSDPAIILISWPIICENYGIVGINLFFECLNILGNLFDIKKSFQFFKFLKDSQISCFTFKRLTRTSKWTIFLKKKFTLT